MVASAVMESNLIGSPPVGFISGKFSAFPANTAKMMIKASGISFSTVSRSCTMPESRVPRMATNVSVHIAASAARI